MTGIVKNQGQKCSQSTACRIMSIF
jgi:hypothetical protein